MRFLIDAQLPPALADWLAAKGHAATQATRDLNGRLPLARESAPV
jgi:predicted nuclease of predicted toxin-antitoxin system